MIVCVTDIIPLKGSKNQYVKWLSAEFKGGDNMPLFLNNRLLFLFVLSIVLKILGGKRPLGRGQKSFWGALPAAESQCKVAHPQTTFIPT